MVFYGMSGMLWRFGGLFPTHEQRVVSAIALSTVVKYVQRAQSIMFDETNKIMIPLEHSIAIRLLASLCMLGLFCDCSRYFPMSNDPL